jgi:hypothetical protein
MLDPGEACLAPTPAFLFQLFPHPDALRASFPLPNLGEGRYVADNINFFN